MTQTLPEGGTAGATVAAAVYVRQAYPAYRESGVPWLGQIPAHWQVKRLRYACTLNPSKTEVAYLPGDTEVSFLPMEAVGEEGELCLDIIRPLEDVRQGYTYARDGDVVVAKITPCFENGKGALCGGFTNSVGFGTTELHVLRPEPHTDGRYLFYVTKTHPFRLTGAAMMQGAAGQQRVPEDFIKDFTLGLPPLDEQRAIAAYLDHETARLDALVAAKQRLITLLREKRAALISHAVTRGLDASVPLRDSGVPWLGQIPAHWQVKRLKETVDICQNGIWGEEPQGDETDIPVVRVADFDRTSFRVAGVIPTSRSIPFSQRPGRLLSRGNLLLEKSGGGELQPVGAVVLYDLDTPAVCSNFVARLAIRRGHSSNYLCYLHAAMYAVRLNVRSIKQNTGIQNLDSDAYLSELVGLPPLAEQRAIAAYLDHETARIDTLVASIERQLEKLREYRSAVIAAAVTGKIDVR